MTPVTPRKPEALLRFVAWGAILASSVPDIILRDPGQPAPLWSTGVETLLILSAVFAAIWVPRLRRLTRFLVAVAILNLVWDYVYPTLTQLHSVRAVTDRMSWGARLFLERSFSLSGVVLVSLTLIGSGLARQDLFLCVGNPAAPARPIPFVGLRRPIPWTWLGPAFILGFAVVLAPYLYLTEHPNFGIGERIVRTLPWTIAVAAFNAASEEFQFRSVLLAHLRGIFPPGETILLTAAFFGLGHFHGHPSGTLGVVMAGFAGWIWARSMVDTRGGVWAFLIHMAQDVVILMFLVVGAGM